MPHEAARFITAPGLWIQRITTREPTDDMIEVAIVALKSALPEEFSEEEVQNFFTLHRDRYEAEGLEQLVDELRLLDPEYYRIVDLKNPKRVIHALEICYMTGRTYTSFRTRTAKKRPFRIIKIGLRREREELYERINRRVDQMIDDGLIEEARRVYPYRHLNSLNTVGYKELFAYFDGNCTLEFAIEKIKQNSRIYSRKQMTWFRRDEEIRWFHPDEQESIMAYIENIL